MDEACSLVNIIQKNGEVDGLLSAIIKGDDWFVSFLVWSEVNAEDFGGLDIENE